MQLSITKNKVMKLIKISKGEYKAENKKYSVSVSHIDDNYGSGKMWFASILNKETSELKNDIEPSIYLRTIKQDLINLF